MQMRSPLRLLFSACLLVPILAACGRHDAVSDGGVLCNAALDSATPLVSDLTGLRIHEVVSSNDGIHVDELGETDDWLELHNGGSSALELSRYLLADGNGNQQRLPARTLEPGAVVLLWADGQPEQGDHHLAMKLSAGGEQLALLSDACTAVDRLLVPALSTNESYARQQDGSFARCRYASPGQKNGVCAPTAPRELADNVKFAPYTWPAGWPQPASPLVINELALRPASFVEVVNSSAHELALGGYTLRLQAIRPDDPAPSTGGVVLAWPAATLAAGARLIVPVAPGQSAELMAQPEFEGAATIRDSSGQLIDRLAFMTWPEGAVLARSPDLTGGARFCTNLTPNAVNECTSIAARPLPDRSHALHGDGDFAALAAGGTELGLTGVKFVIDLNAGDLVHLLSARRWALHYQFVRERIELAPALDRCDPQQALEFDEGWSAFGRLEYFRTLGRRFLLGTLVRHANGMQTVEFAAGDTISAALMRRAFLAAIAGTPDPRAWSLRPADSAQIAEMRKLERSLPIVGPNAPFAGLTYQPLTRAESFGVLRFVPAAELEQAALGPRTIVITDDVPNDVPFVGGIITEAFQTPLSHVNVLSQARGSPNMALRHARSDARLAPLLGKLVRLEVGTQDFQVREATQSEVDAFWQLHHPTGPRVALAGDTGVRHVLPLSERSLADLPAIGAKAAQFAELYRVGPADQRCEGELDLAVPSNAFAIPFAHYLDHFVASGAQERLRLLREEASFRNDPSVRAQGLAAVREAILSHPVEPALLAEVEAAVHARFGNERVRFRSSSNAEDLPTFNGAGLHSSISAELDDPERKVADALRLVWSSLWNMRAYDERESANIDQAAVLMGVLVHAAFGGEAAQGVAISRDLLDITRDDIYYVNTQRGEATVTNPAPGVTTEELLYTWRPRTPELSYRSESSFANGTKVLALEDARRVACALAAVHNHFRPLLDPLRASRSFAMQIEFKLERDGTLVVKQARPQPFAAAELPSDCR